MKTNHTLRGLIAAPFTPFDAQGEVNCPSIDKYAEFLISQGISGVFICGTTGESASLTTDERKRIAERWVAAAAGRLKVIVHVGGNCIPQSRELAAHAQRIGAYATAAMSPFFFKPASARELVDFFVPVAAAAPALPFFYYHMPSMTGVSIDVEEFLRLGGETIPNLAGVKYTHNNLMEMQALLNLEGGRFEVLHGFDEILLAGLALGAKAGVGSTYNYIAPVYLRIMECVEKGDLEEARRLQMISVEVVKIIIRHGGGVRGGKAIMNLLGIECGTCRRPLTPWGENELETLRKELENIDFFSLQK